MDRVIALVFGAYGQVAVGACAFVVSLGFWMLGTFIIPDAATVPWRWTPSAFIFHASMFALVVASFAISSSGLSVIWLDKRTPGAE